MNDLGLNDSHAMKFLCFRWAIVRYSERKIWGSFCTKIECKLVKKACSEIWVLLAFVVKRGTNKIWVFSSFLAHGAG